MDSTSPVPRRRPPTSLPLDDPDALLSYLRELAVRLKKPSLNCRDVNSDGRVNINTLIRRFGGFSNALIKAGLRPSRTYKRDPGAMLQSLYDLIQQLKRYPSKAEVKDNLPFSPHHFARQFGSLEAACKRAESSISAPSGSAPRPSPFEATLAETKTRRRYGPVLNFRGLRHAPINEQGVVFLFGMLASDLGFVVESIQGGFPDCDAKLRRKDGSFEGVRIEFEFKSSEFLRHKHDPAGCDFIVCWEDDWPDCPLPVIELSVEVRQRATNDLA